MPPHCDTLDGPVVTAAAAALDTRDVTRVLPFVPKDGEDEVRTAFDRVIGLRAQGHEIRDLADRWFFENVVRIHRAGEGAPYTGLKPAGLDEGPVIPVAEHAIEIGSPEELVNVLTHIVEDEVRHRFAHLMELQVTRNGDVDKNREYVEAMLGLEVWSHSLAKSARAEGHAAHHAHA